MNGQTVLDFGPIVMQLVQTMGYVVIAVAAWWLQGHVKDQNARTTLLNAATNGVNNAINRIAAAGPQMNVSVASGVSAMAAKYVLDMAPDAVSRLGLDEKKVVNLVVSKLPGVNGELDDKTMDFIASRLSGKPGTAPPPTDYSALVNVLSPMLKQAVDEAVAAHYPGNGAKPAGPATTEPVPATL